MYDLYIVNFFNVRGLADHFYLNQNGSHNSIATLAP